MSIATWRLAVMAQIAVAAAVAAGGASVPSATARPAPVVTPTQELAVLLTPHTVHSAPGGRPSKVRGVRASRPITGGRTVLPVIGRATEPLPHPMSRNDADGVICARCTRMY